MLISALVLRAGSSSQGAVSYQVAGSYGPTSSQYSGYANHPGSSDIASRETYATPSHRPSRGGPSPTQYPASYPTQSWGAPAYEDPGRAASASWPNQTGGGTQTSTVFSPPPGHYAPPPSHYPASQSTPESDEGRSTTSVLAGGGATVGGLVDRTSSNPPLRRSASRASSPAPRPYTCEVCGFSFARNHDLTRHARGHEPASFRCERCGKAYTRLDSLRRHYVRKQCGPNYVG